VTGARSDNAASRLIFQIQQVHVWPRVDEDAALQAALFAIAEIRPQSGVEGMLSAQMIAVHNAALMFLSRATQQDQYPESIERNLLLSNRLLRTLVDQVAAMQALQGKTGQQKVVVEHCECPRRRPSDRGEPSGCRPKRRGVTRCQTRYPTNNVEAG
jgi:hypothetical protein